MRYFSIGDEDTVLGLNLAGVEGAIVHNPQEASDAFDAAIEDREIGIIVITERIAELIRSRVDRFIFAEQFPLILEIPDRAGKLEGKPGLREMVNNAIGISL
ncbi:MAG: Vacuolar H+transporting two-sector ATPase F subunit [Spirochaetales bacterium]|jgi:V/A-type H+/Na+-transporting ATPase subunit F|nr:Vacuolar H+transporting two-sector ATPase F subunit [Spirochaetales bacterium]